MKSAFILYWLAYCTVCFTCYFYFSFIVTVFLTLRSLPWRVSKVSQSCWRLVLSRLFVAHFEIDYKQDMHCGSVFYAQQTPHCKHSTRRQATRGQRAKGQTTNGGQQLGRLANWAGCGVYAPAAGVKRIDTLRLMNLQANRRSDNVNSRNFCNLRAAMRSEGRGRVEGCARVAEEGREVGLLQVDCDTGHSSVALWVATCLSNFECVCPQWSTLWRYPLPLSPRSTTACFAAF